ncbi:acyltransferase [Gaetbulibacter sp. NE]|uniref:acyltransferase n=1 Tax=Gaetbulibacter sp. NE TaxID=2982307 RepID=UPI0021D03AD6|nr:acyltransferase [Gaetbulibacter sp. NE]
MSLKKIIRKKIHQKLDWLYAYIKTRTYKESENKISGIITEIKSVGYGFKYNGTNLYISKPKKVIIGNNVHIGDNFYAKTDGGLIIGHNTHISRNVTLYTENHNYEGVALPYDHTSNYKPVIIGDNVWVGMNVSIMPGVTIGEGAIIGLGTVVNRDVKPYEVVGPALAQTIKLRDVDHYKLLNLKKAYGGVNGDLLSKENLKDFLPTYKDFKDKPIVFVLSTGRSGSMSITNILNQHPACKAFHEDIIQLIRLSTQLAYDFNNQKLMVELLAIFETKVWSAQSNQLIVHSDQRLWNLIPFLATFFTKSKFIHLVRQPEPCISSMVARNWYQDEEFEKFNNHEWAKFRLQGDKVGAFTSEEWSKLTNIQKCVWYYFYINETINAELKNISDDRTMYLELETIGGSIYELQKFLGLMPNDLKVVKMNAVKPQDKVNLESLSSQTIKTEIDLMKAGFDWKI